MESFTLTVADNPELAVDLAGRLAAGQVGILPTETVYGLVCACSCPRGRARLTAMKQRNPAKHFQYLVPDLSFLKLLDISATPLLTRLADAFWPGPLTVVTVNAAGQSVGLRVPDYPLTQVVLRALGEPLIATSANRSGNDPVRSVAEGFADLAIAPDFVVTAPGVGGLASTVVRLSEPLTVLREGALSTDLILAQLAGPGAGKGH